MIDARIDRGHTPYREIGRRAELYVERAGIPHTQDEVRRLISEIERLGPFDEAFKALGRLGQRYTLAILSNGDPEMLENAKPRFGFRFDHVISVAEADHFKPHAAAYCAAAERLGSGNSPKFSPDLATSPNCDG